MKVEGVRNSAKVWAYLVVSSEQQAETLTFQRDWANEVARQHHWTITETFDGVSSGRDGTRKLLDRLLERLEETPRNERPTRVLMTRLDRLGRGLGLEALAAMARITELGVVIHTRQDGDNKIVRASDSILPLMRIVTGGIENEARRDKAMATYRRRRENGQAVSNKRPYGILLLDGHDTVQEPEATAVRLAFELAANGFGYAAIGTRLRTIAPPKRYRNGRVHETEWTNDRVRKLLFTKAYKGVVIEERLWNRVHRLLEHAPDVRSRVNPWPLSGALRCSCGLNLIGSVRGSPPRRVYRCSAVNVHKRHLTFAAPRVESQFVDLLATLDASPKLIRQYTTQVSSKVEIDRAALQSKRAEHLEAVRKADMERKRIWSLNASGLLPDRHLTQRLEDLDDRVTDARGEITRIDDELDRSSIEERSAEQARALVKNAARLWQDAEPADKAIAARALSRALHGFHVTEDGVLRIGEPPQWSRFFTKSSMGLQEGRKLS